MSKAARPSNPDSKAPARPVDGPREAARATVQFYYSLFLAREPESEAAYDAYADRDPTDLIPDLSGSPEFIARVVEPLERGENPWALSDAPSKEIVAWIVRTLPLTQTSARRLRKVGDAWPRVFEVLTADAKFRDAAKDARLIGPAAVQTLRNLSLVMGQIERADAAVVAGWAGPMEIDAGPLMVELWIDGAFIASTRADGFRRDIQDRFGGDGLRGFSFTVPKSLLVRGEASTVSVTAGPERVSIGSIEVALPTPDLASIGAYRDEIQTLKAMIQRLEQAIPAAFQFHGTVDDWNGYYQAWYPSLTAVRPDAGRWTVLVDVDAATPPLVQATVASVVDQAVPGDRIVLAASRASEPFARDLAVRATRMGQASVLAVQTELTDPGERLDVALRHAGASDFILLIEAGTLLAQPALALLTTAFAEHGATQALYVDEDAFDPEAEVEAEGRGHYRPLLKPAFDPDLILQTPFVGTTLAFRAPTLSALGLRSGRGGLHGPDAVLRLPAQPGAIGHLPRVLATSDRPRSPDLDLGESWAVCVADHLAATGSSATVEPHRDILGAVAPDAVRVRRPITQATATVIIPTRDRLDLLRPCIDSLLAREVDNRTRMHIKVIDHESTDPELGVYLSELAEGGRVSVTPFAGEFNWALMNNLAAAETDSDVLVFLNNDTVALSPDWLDELTAQALREEVGIVGCRLIYEDGTIQHGGFVSRGDDRHALIHDGVGDPGSGGGYMGRYALLRRSPVVTGACLAIRRSVFETLGGFDAANFPVEGNDADLCFRARAAGLRVLYDPYATLYHLESKSRGFSVSGEKRAATDRAIGLLQRRWPDQYGVDAGFNPHFDRAGRPFQRLRLPPAKILLA